MSEYKLVEKPIIEFLQGLGYEYIHHNEHPKLRQAENLVLFKPHVVEAIQRINNVDKLSAESVYNELLGLEDNEKWLFVLRGNLSKKVLGNDTHRTIQLIDFDNLANNRFCVTSQLKVSGATNRIPDVVIYVNGIPLVVIEAKSPLNASQNAWDAIHQVRSAEKEIPRLFHSNLFNIATNDLTFMYGATGAPKEFWFKWRDPWPKVESNFHTPTELGLYALLEPSRLLDILAHFIVFEVDEKSGRTIKKVCRYQQLRAVNKMVDRVNSGTGRKGLVWHTQGSGKSLTMAFATLKLKYHRGIDSPNLANPNILVITDRKDLDRQIANTFRACGLANPEQAESIRHLREMIARGGHGHTVMGTIHKFYTKLDGDSVQERMDNLAGLAVAGSENWIVLVDECHRTQEKDLGAYLRATLPNATFFGFTGTPVKKGDVDTFQNFGEPNENYLDKYGIDDAVRDGATVPIYYESRMTEWHLEGKELDVLFDQWFAEEDETVIDELKRRGVTKADLARFPERVSLNAYDIWTHFSTHVLPDGYKAQVVAIDRPACVLYKKALDKHIAKFIRKLVKKGEDLDRWARLLRIDVDDFDDSSAEAISERLSVPVFSPAQHDSEKHPELVPFHLDEEAEKQVIRNFTDPKHPLKFLIVCNKYLTGFDAPVEQTMYLDSPLTDQNLLQAIARTNRRHEKKPHGLIVDYIGVSKSLNEALSAYRKEDIAHAMQDLDVLRDDLRRAHHEVMAVIRTERTGNEKADVIAAVEAFAGEDEWYVFRARAKNFMAAYGALSPDPQVLPYADDLRFVAAMIPYGRLKIEGEEEVDYRHYSEKIREMLEAHLEVTGLKTVCKLRNLTDAEFWTDFDNPKDLEVAAVRKIGELKKVLRERMSENALMYEKFSERIKELIEKFQQGQLAAAEFMSLTKNELEDLLEEDRAYEKSGLTKQAYGIWRILDAFPPELDAEDASEDKDAEKGAEAASDDTYDEVVLATMSKLQKIAAQLDALYASDESAPRLWQEKDQLKKDLRQQVRKIVYPLKLKDWTQIPNRVEEYAIKQYAKW